MNIKRLTQLSLLTATALIIFVIELRIPNIIPIPGIKLGLANIITVYCVYHFNAFETALMLTSRIILGALFSGNIFSLVYSTAGAFFCLCGMLVIRRIIPEKYIWLCSVIGAVSSQYRTDYYGSYSNGNIFRTCILSDSACFRLYCRIFYGNIRTNDYKAD